MGHSLKTRAWKTDAFPTHARRSICKGIAQMQHGQALDLKYVTIWWLLCSISSRSSQSFGKRFLTSLVSAGRFPDYACVHHPLLQAQRPLGKPSSKCIGNATPKPSCHKSCHPPTGLCRTGQCATRTVFWMLGRLMKQSLSKGS